MGQSINPIVDYSKIDLFDVVKHDEDRLLLLAIMKDECAVYDAQDDVKHALLED